jgi:arginase family enzyme
VSSYLGDVAMNSGETEASLSALESRVRSVVAAGVIPIILGGDHTIALPDVTALAHEIGWGRVSVIHFDAHADTAETQFGSLFGHGGSDAPAHRVRRLSRRSLLADWTTRLLARTADAGLDGGPGHESFG